MQLFDEPLENVEDDADIAEARRMLPMRALAAQHLVAADLLCKGFNCSTAAEGLRYDLIADIFGLKRIQVKMTCGLQMAGGYPRYRFWGGKHNSKLRDYQGDIDLFAFVVMDLRRIKYALPKNIDLSCAAFRSAEFDADCCDLAWRQVLRDFGS